MRLGVVEHGRGIHGVALGGRAPEQALDVVGLAALRTVAHEVLEDPGTDYPHVRGVVLEEARPADLVARAGAQGLRELCRRGHLPLQLGAFPAGHSQGGKLCLLGEQERMDVRGEPLALPLDQAWVEVMVDHVVAHPPAHVGAERRAVVEVVGDEGVAERLKARVTLLARRGADAREQLVDVEERERKRRAGHLASAHARAPREVAAQLAQRHGAVGGVVLEEVPLELVLVLEVFHEPRLLVEQLVRGARAVGECPTEGGRASLRLRPRELAELVVALGYRLGVLCRETRTKRLLLSCWGMRRLAPSLRATIEELVERVGIERQLALLGGACLAVWPGARDAGLALAHLSGCTTRGLSGSLAGRLLFAASLAARLAPGGLGLADRARSAVCGGALLRALA